MTTRPKNLSLLAKLLVFTSLILLAHPARAEYYLVYSATESDLCAYCHSKPRVHRHRVHALSHPRVHSVVHYRRHRPNGLYAYYPVAAACPCKDVWTTAYCACCPNPPLNRTQYGDYVVFSHRPTDITRHIKGDSPNGYDYDRNTQDDARPDMEIN